MSDEARSERPGSDFPRVDRFLESEAAAHALTFALASLAFSASASAEVVGARVDAARGLLLVDVSYGGGCLEHKFKLEVGMCMETFPVSCSASVVDVTEGVDMCEAIIHQTVEFGLKENGLTDGYYSGGTLTFKGYDNESFSVRLPK